MSLRLFVTWKGLDVEEIARDNEGLSDRAELERLRRKLSSHLSKARLRRTTCRRMAREACSNWIQYPSARHSILRQHHVQYEKNVLEEMYRASQVQAIK